MKRETEALVEELARVEARRALAKGRDPLLVFARTKPAARKPDPALRVHAVTLAKAPRQ